MATEAANAAIRYAFGHLGAKAISIGYFDRNEPSRRIVEKLGFQKLGVAHNAATRCLDGTKLDRHEYILTSPEALPELDGFMGVRPSARVCVSRRTSLRWRRRRVQNQGKRSV